MPPATRFLQGNRGQSPATGDPTDVVDGDRITIDSDVVAVLAALLCALICVVGLAAVARCAWFRRTSGDVSSPAAATARLPRNKGLKKKALKSLPIVAYDDSLPAGAGTPECAICLSEFSKGDEIRVLPHCGHVFHVGCVDTWLGSHSTCPSCRRILVLAPPTPTPTPDTKCEKCGCSSSASAGDFLP